MAHLSEDSQLCHLLSQPEVDVFKSIAATWKKKEICNVSDADRNAAKQICYGMLYGIGVKGLWILTQDFSSHFWRKSFHFLALSEQLCVVEEEAAAFMSSFKTAYPGIYNLKCWTFMSDLNSFMFYNRSAQIHRRYNYSVPQIWLHSYFRRQKALPS